MGRTKKDPGTRTEMCARFVRLMDEILHIGTGEIAKKLGYRTAATIVKVRRKETFPDMERLLKLASIESEDGSRPNIHWLVTGEGTPLLRGERRGRHRVRDMAERIVRDFGLDEGRMEALRCLLGGTKYKTVPRQKTV